MSSLPAQDPLLGPPGYISVTESRQSEEATRQWPANYTLLTESLYWLDKLEDLLCDRVRDPWPMDFPQELVAALTKVLDGEGGVDRYWSGPSLVWDIMRVYHDQGKMLVPSPPLF